MIWVLAIATLLVVAWALVLWRKRRRAREQKTVAAGILDRARQLFKGGQFQDSEAAFRSLLEWPISRGDGLYGIAVIHIQTGDLDSAERELRECLKLNSFNADAHYYTGVIAEKRGIKEAAQSAYHDALSIDPHHVGALKKLGIQAAPPAPATAQPHAQGQPTSYGLMALIQRDPSEVAKQALGLIARLEMRVKPRFSAFYGGVLTRMVALIGVLLALTLVLSLLATNRIGRFVPFLAPGGDGGRSYNVAYSIVAIVGSVVVLWRAAGVVYYILWTQSLRYVIEQGRVQISEGVFTQRSKNIELLRVLELELHQDFLNRLTGDGSIDLVVGGREGHRPEKLRGLAEIERLGQILVELRNLVVVLRSGGWDKGIIG